MHSDYPVAPVVGVGAVIVRDGRALVIRRAHEPRKGEWSLPGGRVELGETLVEALRREMKEETGLDIEVGPTLEVFDRVHRDTQGRVRYHFVIVDYVCAPAGGVEQAGDDAAALAWVTADEIASYGINRHAADLIRKGLALQWRR
jgi:ADP-ribose pyrophosphatase YjhB (NUDIX family)